MRTGLVVGVILLFALPSAALDVGSAKGTMRWNDKTIELSYAAARLHPREFDPSTTEIELIVSDQPISKEDLEDDTIPFARGWVSIPVREGKTRSFVLHIGYSEAGGGVDDFVFDATVANGKVLQGRAATKTPLRFEDGDEAAVDVEFSALIVSVVEPPFSDAEKASASKSDLAALYLAYLRAEDAESIKPLLTANAAKELDEEYSGMVSLLRSDVEADQVQFKRVRIDGDKALLRAETSDRDGFIRFVRENGAWKIRKETWHYK